MKMARSFAWLIVFLMIIQPVSAQNKAGLGVDSTAAVTEADAAHLLSRLNQVYITLNRINYTTGTRMNLQDIEGNLNEVKEHLKGLKDNLSGDYRAMNSRTLQMYELLIIEMLSDLEEWRASLLEYEDKVRYMTSQMDSLRKDSSFQRLRNNVNLRNQFAVHLSIGRQKWRAADSTLKRTFSRINVLETRLSENYIDATESRNKVRRLLREKSSHTFTKEAPYLWEVSIKDQPEAIEKTVRSNAAEKKAIGYYFSKRYPNRVALLIAGFLFFGWVAFNFRALKKLKQKPSSVFGFIKPLPVAASLVVLFTLSPLFDLYSPGSYYQLMQAGLMLALTVIFAKRWPRMLFWNWMGIVSLFLLFAFSRTMVAPGFTERWFLAVLNIGSAFYTANFMRRLGPRMARARFVHPVMLAGITLNIAAALFNVFGRLTLAQNLGAAAIFSLSQIIGLAVFIQIINESLYLQVCTSRARAKMKGHVTIEQVSPRFRKLLTGIVLLLWAIVFASNLNLYGPVYKAISKFLTMERHLGSTGFTLGNLAVFLLVLWVSFVLQKFTGYFMGIIDHEQVMTENIGRKGNRLLFVRLVIVIAGFIMAIAASGLPVDKLTIIFSALGVGIGLGLQNIVNNFVSGIILIFERPFHIGDTIEIGGKLGRVKNISVRSSVIQTEKGAEIIVPNGDLLSQQVINWTLTNRNVLAELRITLTGSPNFRKVKALVLDLMKEQAGVMQEKKPLVLIEEINSAELSILIQYWISDITHAEEIQSEIRTQVYSCMKASELQLASSR